MRRIILEEPVSRPARWSPRVALFAIIVTLLTTILIRLGRIDYDSGFIALGIGLSLGVLAILLSLIAFIRIWQEGRRGLGSAIRGILLALVLLAYPTYLALRAATLPPILDVTTDTANPPSFSRSRAAMAARGGYLPPEPRAGTREEQRAGYEQIAPLSLDMGTQDAFALVERATRDLGWSVVEAQPPDPRFGTARIDAIAHTLVLHLPEDVTIRIRPTAEGARVDIRSASRLGKHDLGSNAQRVRAFLDQVATLAIAAK
jgi:uncharacterized protein (DUF1499 family)